MILALVLSATFNLAPGQTAECQAYSQRIVSAAPAPVVRPPILPTAPWLCGHNKPCAYARCTPPLACEATTRPEVIPCEIRGDEMWTEQPVVGEAIIFAVRSVDPDGVKSQWVGGP